MTSKPPILTHQPGEPADSASRKKQGGSPKPPYHPPTADLECLDDSDTPIIGEIVFSWNLYETRWKPYEVVSVDRKLCRVSRGLIWSVMSLDSGNIVNILSKYLHRPIG